MGNDSSVGERIRMFRKRAGVSQSSLELNIGASFGSLSRIENGQTNPTKETMDKIAKAIGLNSKETSYLFGLTVGIPSEKEVQSVIAYCKEYLDLDDRYGYLIDDTWHYWHYTEAFRVALGMSKAEAESMIGHHIIEMLFSYDYPMRKRIEDKHFKELATTQISFFKQSNYFRSNEEWYKDLISRLSKFSSFDELWNQNLLNVKEYDIEHRVVSFRLATGEVVPMYYTRNKIEEYTRFEIIEYLLHLPNE